MKSLLIGFFILLSFFSKAQEKIYMSLGMKHKTNVSSSSVLDFRLNHENPSKYFSLDSKTLVYQNPVTFALRIGRFNKKKNGSLFVNFEGDNAKLRNDIRYFNEVNDLFLENSETTGGGIFYMKIGLGFSMLLNRPKLHRTWFHFQIDKLLPAKFSISELIPSNIQTFDQTELVINRTVSGEALGWSSQFGITHKVKIKKKYAFSIGLEMKIGFSHLAYFRTDVTVTNSLGSKTFIFYDQTRGSGMLLSLTREINFRKKSKKGE
jgi:hypothetical protein